MNREDFNIYHSDTIHNHPDYGTIQIFGHNEDEDSINFKTMSDDRGREVHGVSIDEFRHMLSQPRLNHYAQGNSVMWPFQKGDRYFKKGLHNDRVYDVTLTTKLAVDCPATFDRMRDMIKQRKYHAINNMRDAVNRRGIACLADQDICIFNETDEEEQIRSFNFGPRKIEGDRLYGSVRFFKSRTFEIELVPQVPGVILDKYQMKLKDSIVSMMTRKTLNKRGKDILANFIDSKYDSSLIEYVTDDMAKDAKDFYDPPVPTVTTKVFYKSIHLLDIGGPVNEDLKDIPFFKDMISLINREYT